MIGVFEDYRNEFKLKLTDKLEKEVISFLNTKGGNIYIGIDDNGFVVGLDCNVDDLQKEIKDRIKNNIVPSTLGLFDCIVENKDNKLYIKIVIAEGVEKPYYLRGFGMSIDGCFIRVGSSIQAMSNELINKEINKRTRNSLRNIISPIQDLSFSQLKIYYEEKKYKINRNFLKQLEFFTSDGKYNYLAYLFSDNNNVPILFAKYDGVTSTNIIENENYGGCSLIKAAKQILSKLEIENKTYTKITYPERKEVKSFDYIAVREAVINAIVHNDWSYECSPKFELYSDRIVISSNGGLVSEMTKEEFLQGFSLPKNKEIMRIFKDLDLVEQMGTGVLRIVESYDPSVFKFFSNFIRVSIPLRNNIFINNKVNDYLDSDLNQIQKSILDLISDKPNITQHELSILLDVHIRTIQRNIKILIENDILRREGATKKGIWIINRKNDDN